MFSDQEIEHILTNTKELTDMRENRPEEYAAFELLRDLLQARHLNVRDKDGAQGMHDFDLLFNNDRWIAIEVTSDTSQVDSAFVHQLQKLNPLVDEGLTHSWHVDIEVPSNDHEDQSAAGRRTKNVKQNLTSFLVEVEENCWFKEVDSIPTRQRDDEPEIVKRLRNLGVRSATYFKSDSKEKSVLVGIAPWAGTTGQLLLAEMVKDHIAQNKDKLLRSKSDHGAFAAHLFIWLKVAQKHLSDRSSALSNVRFLGLQEIPCVDLHGVDTVWIAHESICTRPYLYPIVSYDHDGWHEWKMRACPPTTPLQ